MIEEVERHYAPEKTLLEVSEFLAGKIWESMMWEEWEEEEEEEEEETE